MEPQIIVSLASAGVAGLAVAANLVTTLLSLRAQRENMRDTQERLSVAQERALHERSHAQDLRDKRVEPYLALIKWTDRLLEALDDLDELAKPYLSVEEWNIRSRISTERDPLISAGQAWIR
ncbi:hypothetical protein ACIREM_09885 [Streptomyces shenzhenensis]|uniref:hypothetical protein n=1 Tax=Streptomyces shenzhenensis TaxID=943815 RepID=UPI0037F28E4F